MVLTEQRAAYTARINGEMETLDPYKPHLNVKCTPDSTICTRKYGCPSSGGVSKIGAVSSRDTRTFAKLQSGRYTTDLSWLR